MDIIIVKRDNIVKRDDSAIALGIKIKQARTAKGWSQIQLGTLLNIPQPSVSDIESGQKLPDIILLARIAEVLFNCKKIEIKNLDKSFEIVFEESFKETNKLLSLLAITYTAIYSMNNKTWFFSSLRNTPSSSKIALTSTVEGRT